MRMLFPSPAPDVDPAEVYAFDRRAVGARPWVLVGMVTSIDGATALEGVSGGLGGEVDRQVFRAVRALADVILVAAGTVRAERYGPPRLPDSVQAARQARGQAPVPRLAVVSRRLDLDPAAALFREPDAPPWVLTTTDADAARREALAPVAEIVEAGTGRVDLGVALAALAERGAEVVVSEGGPSLNGQLGADDLVDELAITLAPALVGGPSARLAHHPEPGTRHDFSLAHVLEEDGVLALHYLRAR